MNFTTIFPETQNVHLVKDVGIIPYQMHKKFGYNSTLICYKNGEYPYLSSEVQGLSIDFLKRYTGNPIFDISIYLFKKSKNIDVLNLFHLNIRSFLWIFIYKKLNKYGKVYLKLDADRNILKLDFSNKSIKNRIRIWGLKKCQLISVETKELYNYINKNWPVKVELIPNGFMGDKYIKRIYPEEKENYIITVGRIGSKEKANEVLMESFARIYNLIPNWKIKFIGPIDEKFKLYICKYFNKYPQLKDKIIFTGAIYDKEKLEIQYRKAKIFCLTSLHESFGIVLVEAIKNGCYIISSNVSAAFDVTNNGEYGDIFNIGDIDQLSKLLIYNCNNDSKLSSLYIKIQEYAYKNYNWVEICNNIYKHLQ